MTLFGQLPNQRWRCWVEMDELIQSMNTLVSDLASFDEDKAKNQQNINNNGDIRTSMFDQNKNIFCSLTKNDFISRGYPIIGAVPTSLIEEFKKSVASRPNSVAETEPAFISETPPSTSPTADLDCIEFDAVDSQEETVAIPYSSHNRRGPRRTTSQSSFDSLFFTASDEAGGRQQGSPKLKPKPISGSFPRLQTSPFYHNNPQINIDSEKCEDITQTKKRPSLLLHTLPGSQQKSMSLTPNISQATEVRLREDGFIIKKRLRQKGISIIVGSSSSEG